MMKRFISAVLCICILAGVLAGCGITENDSTAVPEYTPGVTTDSAWSSDWIGLSYTLADGFYFATQDEINNLMQISADAILVDEYGNSIVDYSKVDAYYEMMAYDVYGSNVIVCCENNKLGLSEKMYLEAMKRQLKSAELEYTFTELTECTFAGKTMYRTDATTESYGYGVVMHQTYIIMAHGDRMVSIVASSSDEAEIEDMLKAFH